MCNNSDQAKGIFELMCKNGNDVMDSPVVSIIISALNCKDKIVNTLRSIADADNKMAIEIIVVDGGSIDGTQEAVTYFSDDVPITLVSEVDEGIYDAWNKGVNLAKGEWIFFLGAGDLLMPGWVDFLVGLERSDAQIIYGNLLIDFDGKRMLKTSIDWSDAKLLLPYEMSIPHVGLAHHKSVFQNNIFDISYKIIGDWEFMSRDHIVKGMYMPTLVQAVMEMGAGISNAPSRVDEQYRELNQCFHSRGNLMPCRLRLKWAIKRAMSMFPWFYRSLQVAYWRLKCK